MTGGLLALSGAMFAFFFAVALIVGTFKKARNKTLAKFIVIVGVVVACLDIVRLDFCGEPWASQVEVCDNRPLAAALGILIIIFYWIYLKGVEKK